MFDLPYLTLSSFPSPGILTTCVLQSGFQEHLLTVHP